MLDQLTSALNFNRQALALRAKRQKVLANNIANADTPNYKARDFNFPRALAAATGHDGFYGKLQMTTTSPRHMHGEVGAMPGVRLQYRVPAQPSLDGNTVDMNVARVAFAANTMHYEAALRLMNMQIQGLKSAMQPA